MTRHTIWNLSANLDTLNEQLFQSTRSTFNEAVRIQSFNTSTASADVEISFYLREHTPGNTIKVTARGQTATHTATATFTNGHFVATMTLPVQDNYTLTFATDGESVTTGELLQLNLASQLSGRFSYWLSHGQSWGTNQPVTYTFTPYFSNQTNGNPSLKVNALHLTIEVDDTVIQTWDLMPHLQNSADGQTLAIDWDGLAGITVGDEPGNIPPGTQFVARLVIYDNLGIRYEQIDGMFAPYAVTHSRSGGSASTPVPVREWRYHGGYNGWGIIRIVE